MMEAKTMKETVRVQMDKKVAEKAKKVLEQQGLTLDAAVNMLYEKFILTGKLPFEFKA